MSIKNILINFTDDTMDYSKISNTWLLGIFLALAGIFYFGVFDENPFRKKYTITQVIEYQQESEYLIIFVNTEISSQSRHFPLYKNKQFILWESNESFEKSVDSLRILEREKADVIIKGLIKIDDMNDEKVLEE